VVVVEKEQRWQSSGCGALLVLDLHGERDRDRANREGERVRERMGESKRSGFQNDELGDAACMQASVRGHAAAGHCGRSATTLLYRFKKLTSC
jgi:hypothetical protein